MGNGWAAFLPFFSHRKKCLEITLGWIAYRLRGGGCHWPSHVVPVGPLQPFPPTSLMADATSWVALRAAHVSQWFNDLTSSTALFPPLLVGIDSPIPGTSYANTDTEQSRWQ